MKKLNRKITAIIGTATLAVGVMALPVLAGTNQQLNNGWLGQMQGFMQRTISPQQHQALMNSTAMQNLMNSDPVVKAQIGQDNLDKMNQYMSQSINQSGGNIGGMMTNGNGINGSHGTMMNGSRTGSGTGTANKGGMMGSVR